jgi:hypothetical protein
LGSIGIHVEQSGGRKLILRQSSNGLGVNVNFFALIDTSRQTDFYPRCNNILKIGMNALSNEYHTLKGITHFLAIIKCFGVFMFFHVLLAVDY